MSVRDIIAAATQGAWHITQDDSGYFAAHGDGRTICDFRGDYDRPRQDEHDADYVEAFNPEHAALIESVVSGLDNYGCTIDFWDGCPICGSAGLTTRPDAGLVDGFKHDTDCPYVALHALNIYRTERGLS